MNSLSPLDGRYFEQTKELRDVFSEKALTRFRIYVEVKYLLTLLSELDIIKEWKSNELNQNETNQNELKPIETKNIKKKDWEFFVKQMSNLHDRFDMERVKEIEKQINHDVKSVEYYIKEYIDVLGVSAELKSIVKPYVHFALTSQDTTTLALWLQLLTVDEMITDQIRLVYEKMCTFFNLYKRVSMLSRTHGQAATPTTIGKEFMVFAERLENQIELLPIKPIAKFGGCNGNFNAHYVAYPGIDWMLFGDRFLEQLGLCRAQFTTQIDHYDMMCEYFDRTRRINNILVDFCRDVWEYISRDYLRLKINRGEVGSSTMPHKVNPIDFENAEGNLLMANSMFEFFSSKLPISRLQRDLTDSTVTRNFGCAFGYSFVAYKSILKGMSKIVPNIDEINQDLNANYIVVSEAIQTILKVHGHDNAYELLKDFTRKYEKPTREEFVTFINSLAITDELKQRLYDITPTNYIGGFPND